MTAAKKQKGAAASTATKRRKDPSDVGALKRNRDARVAERALRYQRVLPIAIAQPSFTGTYTPELGAALADMVIDGCTLDNIASLPNMPKLYMLARWVADPAHPFNKLYYEAKGAMVSLFEERAIDAATKPLIGIKTIRKQVLDHEGNIIDIVESQEYDNVERSKLMATTYSWSLAHMAPKKHGRQAQVEGGGNEQLNALFAALKSGPADG